MYVLTRLRPEPVEIEPSIIEIFSGFNRSPYPKFNSYPSFTEYRGFDGTIFIAFPTVENIKEYRKAHQPILGNTIIVNVAQLPELYDGSIRADCYRMEYRWQSYDTIYFM